MAENGIQVRSWKYQFRVGSQGTPTLSGSSPKSYGHSARGHTEWVPDIVDTLVGIDLRTQSGYDGTTGVGGWTASAIVPGGPAGGYNVGGSGYRGNVNVMAEVTLSLYGTNAGSLHYIEWTPFDIYVNGAFSATIGSGGSTLSSGVGPNYVPFIGIPMLVEGAPYAFQSIPGFSWNPCNPTEGTPIFESWRCDGGPVGCGWRWQDDHGNWHTPHVSPYIARRPIEIGGICPFGLGLSGVLHATTTWDTSISGVSAGDYKFEYVGRTPSPSNIIITCTPIGIDGDPGEGDPIVTVIGPYTSYCLDPCDGVYREGYSDTYKKTENASGQGGDVMLYPDLPKSFRRLNSDYGAFIWRDYFPSATATVSRACQDGDASLSTSTDIDVYPAVSPMIAWVKHPVHSIEQPLSYTTWSPAHVSRFQTHTETLSDYPTSEDGFTCIFPPPGAPSFAELCATYCPEGYTCGIGGEQVLPDRHPYVKSESISSSFPTSVGDVGGYQYHEQPVPRMVTAWGNPGWLYGYWFEDWAMFGDPTPAAFWWKPRKEQWAYNAFLPPEEQRRTLNSIIASPIWGDNGNTPLLDAVNGGIYWWGVLRFPVYVPAIPDSVQLDSSCESELEGDDCTIACGGDIVLTPSADHIKLRIRVGSHDRSPYLFGHIAKSLQVGWSLTNIDSISVSMIGDEGTHVPLCTTPGTYDKPLGTSSVYAGSWAIENGQALAGISEIGADLAPGGDSAAMMSDPERVIASLLPPTRTYKWIEFDIHVTDPAHTVTVHYPTFYKPTVHPTFVWESAKACTMMWPNGPAIRYGNTLRYEQLVGLMNPPAIAGLGVANTEIDGRCFIKQVFEAKQYNDNLTTELVADHTFFEGQSVGETDKFTNSIPLPKTTDEVLRWTHLNSFQEYPAMACFPWPKRDAVTYLPTGPDVLEALVFDQEPRKYITPGGAPALIEDASHVPWTSSDSSIPGYTVTQHQHAVDNNEGITFYVHRDPIDFANVSPRLGYFYVLASPVDHTKMLALIARPDGRLFRLTADDTDTFLGLSNQLEYTNWLDNPIYATADDGDLARLPSGKVAVLLIISGDCQIGICSDEAGGAVTMASDGSATAGALVSRGSGEVVVYRMDGGTVKGTLRNASDLSLIDGPWDTNLSGYSDDARIDADPIRVAGNKPGAVLSIIDTTLDTYISTDFINFS